MRSIYSIILFVHNDEMKEKEEKKRDEKKEINYYKFSLFPIESLCTLVHYVQIELIFSPYEK